MRIQYVIIIFFIVIFICGCEEQPRRSIPEGENFGVIETMAGAPKVATYNKMTKRLDTINTKMKTRGDSIDNIMDQYK